MAAPLPLTERVAESYEQLGALGTSVLLAVSGGADSTALLLLSAEIAPRLNLQLEVASLDHGLRVESSAEVSEVRALCKGLAIPFHTRALQVPAGPSLEERARRARYQALEELRNERGLSFVATAHTASDQAETLLMRLGRGASLRGAAGVRRRWGRVVRPLLGITRAEVELFLRQRQVTWVADPMNADPRFLRVRVRHQALPALISAIGPSLAQNLARFAALAADDEAFLQQEAERALRRLMVAPGHLDRAGLRALPSPLRRRILVTLAESAGATVDGPTVERALGALERGNACSLPGHIELRCAGGLVRCVPTRFAVPEASGMFLGAAPVLHAPSGWVLQLAPTLPEQKGGWALALGDLPLPLSIRTRRPGDRLVERGHQRKLHDFFVDARVPREQRDRTPLVTDASGRIVAVVGLWPRTAEAVDAGSGGPFVLATHERAPPGDVRYTLPNREVWRVARVGGQNS